MRQVRAVCVRETTRQGFLLFRHGVTGFRVARPDADMLGWVVQRSVEAEVMEHGVIASGQEVKIVIHCPVRWTAHCLVTALRAWILDGIVFGSPSDKLIWRHCRPIRISGSEAISLTGKSD